MYRTIYYENGECKMKTKILDLVLTKDNYDHLNQKWVSYFTVLYSLIINYHPEINKDINSLRDELTSKPLVYPFNSDTSFLGNLGNVCELEFKLKNSKRDHLTISVRDLSKKYRLYGKEWERALKVKILTGILPAIFDKDKINWYSPMNFPNKDENVVKVTGFFTKREKKFIELAEKVDYPAIQITERLKSQNELIKWIKANWESTIQPEIERLPRRIKENASLFRFSIGLWFIKLQRLGKSWKDIDKLVSRIEDDDPNFFGKDGKFTPNPIAKGSDFVYSAEKNLREFYPY